MNAPETLLAMPETDYMNATQLAYFREMLTAMRDEILHNVVNTSEHLRLSTELPDPVDRATQEEASTRAART